MLSGSFFRRSRPARSEPGGPDFIIVPFHVVKIGMSRDGGFSLRLTPAAGATTLALEGLQFHEYKMSPKPCPVCGKEFDFAVQICPHCGRKVIYLHWGWGVGFLGILILLVSIIFGIAWGFH